MYRNWLVARGYLGAEVPSITGGGAIDGSAHGAATIGTSGWNDSSAAVASPGGDARSADATTAPAWARRLRNEQRLRHGAATAQIAPYVVEIDGHGAVRTVGPAASAYEPSDAQIAFHLANFVQNVRSLPIDPIVLRNSWLQAYDFATATAAVTLNDYARDHDPFAAVGERNVAVKVLCVARASEDSFEVRWRESTYRAGCCAIRRLPTPHYALLRFETVP